MLLNLLKVQQECAHEKITPNMDAGYCPDCGEYIENRWFITRCNCCGVKQKTIIVKDKISTNTKYCINCGSNHFVVQELDKINCIDINYAIVLKQIIKDKKTFFTQSWVEPKEYGHIKLITKTN